MTWNYYFSIFCDFIASAWVEVFDMKNFIAIVCDYFTEYTLLNNLENDKKMLTVERLWIFFFAHLKRSVIIILMENP